MVINLFCYYFVFTYNDLQLIRQWCSTRWRQMMIYSNITSTRKSIDKSVWLVTLQIHVLWNRRYLSNVLLKAWLVQSQTDSNVSDFSVCMRNFDKMSLFECVHVCLNWNGKLSYLVYTSGFSYQWCIDVYENKM